ncbi:hypothetical protein D1BOALGB6SA_9253 [Olavius sp. associated proteobacterium Delta 1]|nr:hypothetical protein D1BOALGB6SA_9253 [Olavius sp. associated proteobacterium Delta 1]
MRRNLIETEISEINHALELLPKKLNAYIKSHSCPKTGLE